MNQLFVDGTSLVVDQAGDDKTAGRGVWKGVSKERKLRVTIKLIKRTVIQNLDGRRASVVLNRKLLEEEECFKIIRFICCCGWRDRWRGKV